MTQLLKNPMMLSNENAENEMVKQRTNKAYQQQTDRLRRACRLAKLGIWEMDFEANEFYSSDELFEIYGIPKGESSFIGVDAFLSIVHPDDLHNLKSRLGQLNVLDTHTLEHRIIKPGTGETIYLLHDVQAFKDENGKVCGLYGTTKDVTDIKIKEQELKISNERFEFVCQATSDAIWDWDIKKNTCYFNPTFTLLFGHNFQEQNINDIWYDNIHPEDKESVDSQVQSALNDVTQSHWQGEYRFIKSDGQIAYVFDRGVIIRDEKGVAIRMVGSLQDITQRKEAECALRISEERYKLLFYKCPNPKVIFNATTLQYVEVNEAAIQLYGYSKEEFLHLSISDIVYTRDPSELDKLISILKSPNRNSSSSVLNHKKKNGEVFPVEIIRHGIELPSGSHFIVTIFDLTERLAMQNKIIEEQIAAQKLMTKAIVQTQEKERSMISRELHDNINQILTSAKLCVENTLYYPEQRSLFTDRSISLIQNAIQEIRSLSKVLASPSVYELGLKVTILEMLDQYRNLKRFEITDTLNFDEDVLDKELQLTIYRIIQEQMNNVVKYAQATEVSIVVHQHSNHIMLLTQDNGRGFDVDSKKNGLGLTNMKSRVDLFKGKFEIISAPGKGCKYKIVFPL